MSDIQRWDIDLSNGDPFKSENGDWIEYADHVAAVAAAREGERYEWEEWSNEVADLMPEKYDGDEAQEALILAFVRDAATAYEQGQRDEREHVTDLLTVVVDRIPFQDRFTVFGLLYVQSEQLGWDEVMRRATIRPKLETS